MSIKGPMERSAPCGGYLGREVYIEICGQRKLGRICSVYHDPENGKLTVEVEWDKGTMKHEQFPQILKFTESAG